MMRSYSAAIEHTVMEAMLAIPIIFCTTTTTGNLKRMGRSLPQQHQKRKYFYLAPLIAIFCPEFLILADGSGPTGWSSRQRTLSRAAWQRLLSSLQPVRALNENCWYL